MSNETFLPVDYEAPKSQGAYTKFEEGPTKLRILSSPLLMWVTWNNSQPDRVKYEGPESKPNNDSRHSWALKVWNYKDSAIQVWEITQKSIQDTLKDLAANEDWGNPLEFDLTVNRTGSGMETKYSVTPSPKKELSQEVQQASDEMKVNLEALLEGDSPFDDLPF
jgi:hypothetical protein